MMVSLCSIHGGIVHRLKRMMKVSLCVPFMVVLYIDSRGWWWFHCVFRSWWYCTYTQGDNDSFTVCSDHGGIVHSLKGMMTVSLCSNHVWYCSVKRMMKVSPCVLQSCVVPLYKLLVREKRDERDSHGIYVISQNPNQPEMYELVCRTRDERDQWMSILLEAIKNCPEPGDWDTFSLF